MSEDRLASRAPARDAFLLWLAAIAAALVVGLIAPVYWDSFGYARQALDGDVGGLAFGRPVFALLSRGIAHASLALGGSAWAIEGTLRVWWLAVAATAAPATYALAIRCQLSLRAARLAGAFVALSPALAHTSSAVLTDGASLAVVTWAFAACVESIETGSVAAAAVAGVLAGIAFGVREQSIVSIAGFAIMIPAAPRGRRASLALVMAVAALAAAIAPMLYVAHTQSGYVDSIARWIAMMRVERASHAWSLRDVLLYLAWVFLLGPLAIAAAAVGWRRFERPPRTPRLVWIALTVPALFQLLALMFYPDIAYSPRYLVAALPGAVALPAAVVIDPWLVSIGRRRAIAMAMIAPLLVASPIALRYNARQRAALADLARDVSTLPDRAVIVTGWMCPEIPLLASEARVEAAGGVGPGWGAVCPGWLWPADLDADLDARRREGHTVVLDLRASSWVGDEQRRSREAAERYALSSRPGDTLRIWR